MAEQSAYLVELAERIGPRPAGSEGEAKAAAYIAGVLEARGLAVEQQSFDAPRTYSWAYVLYHLLTILAAVGSRWLPWPAIFLGALVAVVMWSDLDTKWGLTALMPKTVSANVIARHVPKARRNDPQRKVIVVAHYDSARASLAFSPGMVRNFNVTFGLMKGCTFAVPVLALLSALPFAAAMQPWAWYVTMAASAYLVVPLLINVHRELFMKPVDGANDNASGVATMLNIMERLVPEPDASVYDTTSMPRQVVKHDEEDAWAADVVPEGAILSYPPANAPAPGPRRPFEEGDFEDIGWADTRGSDTRQTSMPMADDDSDLWIEPPTHSAPAAPASEPAPSAPSGPRRREGSEPKGGVRDWLGVDSGYDAKSAGNKIGSWDNFEEDEDETGRKGGQAGDRIDDPDFAADEAARIRRRVTSTLDRALVEKEVWFVATGAEEVGTWGMRALLEEHGDDLKDALIINLDNLGSGAIAWVTSEGMARRYRCDRRLSGAARRVATEGEFAVKGRDYRGLSTDATVALARGYKAMSVMAFDINGRLPNWHWETDTIDEVVPENIETATEFVAALIREL